MDSRRDTCIWSPSRPVSELLLAEETFGKQKGAPIVLRNATLRDRLQVIRSEYLEMPGLSLTKPQVQRLWGLDSESCNALIDEMVSVRFLRKTPRNCYVRADISSK